MSSRSLLTTTLFLFSQLVLLPTHAQESNSAQGLQILKMETCDQKRTALKETLTSGASFEVLKKKSVEFIKSVTPEEDQVLLQLVSLRRNANVSEQALKESYESIVGIYRKIVERSGSKFRNSNTDVIPGMSLWFGVTGTPENRDELPAIDARLLDQAAEKNQTEKPVPESFLGIGLVASTQLKRFPVSIILGRGPVLLSQYIEMQLQAECSGVTSDLDPNEFNSIPVDLGITPAQTSAPKAPTP